jgi:hypothetical protein
VTNAMVDSSAAIAGTKISPNFGSQNVVTTGTSTAASFIPTSSSVPTNGVYLPSANNVAISTNGTGRLFVDASGNVGIGRAPVYVFDTQAGAGNGIRYTNSVNSVENILGADSSTGQLGTTTSHPLSFLVGSVERMRLDSSGGFQFKGAGTAGVTQAVSFNGSAPVNSLVIDSSGRVGLGSSSPDAVFRAQGTQATSSIDSATIGVARIHNTTNNADTTALQSVLSISREGKASVSYNNTANFNIGRYNQTGSQSKTQLTLRLANGDTSDPDTDVMTWLASGAVGIGTSSPRINLQTGSSGGIQAANAGEIALRYNLYNDGSDKYIQGANKAASLVLDSTGSFVFYNTDTASTSADSAVSGLGARMVINSSGKVGIGTTTVSSPLHVKANSTEGIRIESPDFTGIYGLLTSRRSSGAPLDIAAIHSVGSLAPEISFSRSTNGSTFTESARIDGDGRLLVGTSSGGGVAKLQVQGSTLFNDAFLDLCYNGSGSIAADTNLGVLRFTDQASSANIFAQIACATDAAAGSGDYPGRLVFSTTADGASSPTERMRLSSGGRASIYGDTDVFRLASNQGGGTAFTLIEARNSETSTTSTSGAVAFRVYTNGDTQNTNNSYAGTSDAKLKENIVDANSQWDDLKALQVRNYNFKEGQTHRQIGLVAQEVELVSPGLVSESPDRDKDGNDLGTVTKSVRYSVLYMKAVKALQEAMERIEVLEQRLTDAGIA